MSTKVGDLVLVYNNTHFEKAEVVSKEKKGVYILSNQVKVDKELNPLNSKLKVKPFNEEEFQYLLAKQSIPRLLNTIRDGVKDASLSTVMTIQKKLEKIVNKL